MEDQDIKNIFENFTPDISPSFDFMKRVNDNLRVIEKIKADVGRERKRNRIAVVVALAVGFVCGVISVCIYTQAVEFVTLHLSSLSLSADYLQSLSYLLVWGAIALFSGSSILLSYDMVRK